MSMIHGRYQDVMKDVIADCVICDPPYGSRTHNGHCYDSPDGANRREINYKSWNIDDVGEFVEFWRYRNNGWFAVFSCSDLAGVWRSAFDDIGLNTFAPIACVVTGATVRLSGDGPANWTTYLNVARPKTKEFSKWGALPGAYVTTRQRGAGEKRVGGKELRLMESIVCDYSRPGNLVVDPCAGYGTTMVAALIHGRRAIGCDVDGDAVDVYNGKTVSQTGQVGLFR